MTRPCGVGHCNNKQYSEAGKRFFRLPKVVSGQGEDDLALSLRRRRAWIDALKKSKPDCTDSKFEGAVICEDHFVFGKPAHFRYENAVNWAPTLNLVSPSVNENRCKKSKQMDKPKKQPEAKRRKLNEEKRPLDAFDPSLRVPNILEEMTSQFQWDETPLGGRDTQDELSSDVEPEFVMPEPVVEESQDPEPPCPTEPEEDDLKLELLDDDGLVEELPAVEEPPVEVVPEKQMASTEVQTEPKIISDTESQTDQKIFFSSEMQTEPEPKKTASDSKCQTDFPDDTRKIKEQLEKLQRENMLLMGQLETIRNRSFHVFELKTDSLKANPSLVQFYTGLKDFDELRKFYDMCNPLVPKANNYTIPRFLEFVMTLMLFRTNVSFEDMSVKFKMTEERVKEVCGKWIEAMYQGTRLVIKWDKMENENNQPAKFVKLYGSKVSSILDMFEVLIPTPQNTEARMLTWSPLRNHHTIKYLLSVTPRGQINYLSDGWGGVVTCQQMTEECGYLEMLEPGDRVLTDKGFVFGLEELLDELDCELLECKKGTPDALFHVDTVIERLKDTFPILGGVIPLYLLTEKSSNGMPLIDKITNVCCALINLFQTVVEDDPAEPEPEAPEPTPAPELTRVALAPTPPAPELTPPAPETAPPVLEPTPPAPDPIPILEAAPAVEFKPDIETICVPEPTPAPEPAPTPTPQPASEEILLSSPVKVEIIQSSETETGPAQVDSEKVVPPAVLPPATPNPLKDDSAPAESLAPVKTECVKPEPMETDA